MTFIDSIVNGFGHIENCMGSAAGMYYMILATTIFFVNAFYSKISVLNSVEITLYSNFLGLLSLSVLIQHFNIKIVHNLQIY